MESHSLRKWAITSFIVSMLVLLVGGYFANDQVAPYPKEIESSQGKLSDRETILKGQDVYQKYGLMDHGSIWGHGTLRGRDFSAWTLHKMGELMREYHSQKMYQSSFDALDDLKKGQVESLVIVEIKKNRFDPTTGVLSFTDSQAEAFDKLVGYWSNVFVDGERENGILPGTIKDHSDRLALAHFFLWTAWVAGTNRPDVNHTYTNNWPADKTVGNVAPVGALVWSLFSIVALLVVLGLVIYLIHRCRLFYGESKSVALGYKLLEMPLTPSQKKAGKFFLLAGALFIAQILNGGLLAHYTVHPSTFFIQQVAELLPYQICKTWHLQLAILWIAISWMGTAIYLAPVLGGKEPKGQGVLVDLLFGAVVLVGVGSLVGEYLGVTGKLGDLWFWLGHQGWEFLELGRLWQILLLIGLTFWLVIVCRALVPKLIGEDKDPTGLTQFYVLSAIAVVAFFGFGLFYGRGTHLTIADYWRWFVVHIWVESVFEFFGVAVTALFLVNLGLIEVKSAVRVSYFTAIIVFLSGILGTAHHYFWYGGPSYWLALGGVFSSLEPIPLIVLVGRAWMEYVSIKAAGKEFPYRWPLYFITASSFWNFFGAGVFGFMINLPIVNYYEHATYLTANHGHTALFGVYGMLAVALILFSWRSMVRNEYWNERLLKISFWGMNGGLLAMSLTVLFPIGIYQIWHVMENGFWWARSSEFYNLPLVSALGTWRMVPDLVIILVGAVPLAYFLFSTFTKLRVEPRK